MTDLLLLWEWEHDLPFVQRVLAEAEAAGVRAAAVGPAEVAHHLHDLSMSPEFPAVVVDRASDALPEAAALCLLARGHGSLVVNDPERTVAAADKARMHLALMSVGLQVPWTILLPPCANGEPVDLDHLHHVGQPFVLKPAHGGGGVGVVREAWTHEDIQTARAQDAEDGYLLQERIDPLDLDGTPAWFRVLYCLGDVHPCFWHPDTFRYRQLTDDEKRTDWGREIDRVTTLTAHVSGMTMFSTELALTASGRLVVVDYVNDMCDLRRASVTPDGVPDSMVDAMAARLVARAARG
ncbi:MAG: hypothetical protein ACOYOB_17685 [Myxococcota bacterium]